MQNKNDEMNPIFEVSLTTHCNLSCDYCIAGTEQFITAVDDKTGKETLGWLYPKLPSDAIIAQDDGEYKVKYTPIICRVPDTDEACIARNRKNKQLPVIGTPVSNIGMNHKKLISFIKKNLAGWDIVLSGGEPLILPNIDETIKEITKTNNVKLLSNCFEIKKHKELLLNPRVAIKVGYHPEFRDIEEFKEKMNFMKEHTDRFYVNYVKHPRHMKNDKILDYIKVLDDLEIKYDITMFKGKWEGKSYGTLWETEESAGMPIGRNKEYISEHSLDPLTKDHFMWNPGKTFLTCYADGRILECHNAVVEIGNINTGEFNLAPNGFKEHLGCINGARCLCDSANSYRYWNTIM